MASGHSIVSTLTLNQATPVLLIAIASVVIFLLQRSFKKRLQQLGFRAKASEVIVD